MLRRVSVLCLLTVGLLAIPLAAQAVDLDQGVCEGDLGGTWNAGTSTCDTTFVLGLPGDLVVPDGVTLHVDTFDPLALDAFNFGTIVAGTWHNHAVTENYGSFTADFLIHETMINHCGSTYAVADDSSAASVSNLTCSVAVAASPLPTNGTAPLTVDWTVTLANDGDEALSNVQIAVSDDGGTSALSTLVPPPASGDDGDDLLEPAETWVFTLQTVEDDDVTLTFTASGTAPSGLIVDFPDDAEARAAGTIDVAAAATTTTMATTTTTSSPSTSSTTFGPTTTVAPTTTSAPATTAEVEGTALTALPYTGAPEQLSMGGLLALALVSTGLLLLALGRAARGKE